jgi:MFS family permease
MISGGAINDRIGPRRVVLAGGLLFGIGMIVSGYATSVPFLLISYGLGCGLGMGMVYGTVVSNAVKFFPDKRGMVGGVTTASYGLSSVIVPVVARALIDSVGISSAFIILGAVIVGVIVLASPFIIACPKGWAPAGWEAEPARATGVIVQKDWRGMLIDPLFYTMIAMLLCGAFSGLMVTSQASRLAQAMAGMDALQSALIVSVLALFNTAGRIASGTLSDKLGAPRTLRLVYTLAIAGSLLLMISNVAGAAAFCAGICIVGFCFGSVMGIYPGFTAAQFGSAHNSVNYGIMFIGFALAGFFGPTCMGLLYASTGSYLAAFALAMVLAAAGLVLTFVFARRKARTRADKENSRQPRRYSERAS